MSLPSKKLDALYRFRATARAAGAIGALWLTGPENELRRRVDAALRPAPPWLATAPSVDASPSAKRLLAYGRILDADGSVVDEVLLERSAGRRVLTGHGGPAAMAALEKFLDERGFQEAAWMSPPWNEVETIIADAPDVSAASTAFAAPATPTQTPGEGDDCSPCPCSTETFFDEDPVEARRRARIIRAVDGAFDDPLSPEAVRAAVDARLPGCRSLGQAAFLLHVREALPARAAAWRAGRARPPTATEAANEYARASAWLKTRHIALVGAPNAGKSALFNALVGGARALVHDTPGTTLDRVSERSDVGGHAVVWHDLPGLHPSDSPLERRAQERALAALRRMDALLFVIDGGRPLDVSAINAFLSDDKDVPGTGFPALRGVVIGKGDLPPAFSLERARSCFPGLPLARTGGLSADMDGAGAAAEAARRTVSEMTRQFFGCWRGESWLFTARQTYACSEGA